jgi:hypothetical protein
MVALLCCDGIDCVGTMDVPRTTYYDGKLSFIICYLFGDSERGDVS